MDDASTPKNPFELLRVITAAQLRTGQGWVRGRGLSLQQAFVLTYLEDHPGSLQRDIARATRTTPANVTGVLRVLEANGLVERSTVAGDQRSKRVSATATGLAAVAGRDAAMAAADEALLAPLDPTERAALTSALAKIADAIDH